MELRPPQTDAPIPTQNPVFRYCSLTPQDRTLYPESQPLAPDSKAPPPSEQALNFGKFCSKNQSRLFLYFVSLTLPQLGGQMRGTQAPQNTFLHIL